ncbi:gliding motility-associated C-terminal domain-containing protein [Flavobacterium sp. NG2]|uniref:DUF7507 domain-containing protein n=1 Tax=Flavobacterium sp. NG2 TaxID=3097547 RepID=UPI002A8210AD|nr:gliding motility-associated C-terminal domain-containing protein [Flavobacterium sp. NG2]WPR72037.1 gliding motility-associated C-terminal domain-containing protein [Flavobacterium sp. NG2]
MRKFYPESLIENFIENISSRIRFNKIVFFLGVVLMSANSFGQCNIETPSPFISDNYDGLTVSKSSTGVCTGLLGCGISNEANLIDADLTNYATANFGVSAGVLHKLRVKDSNTTYIAGSFAGFKIGIGNGLLSLSLLNGISINTYSGTTLKETFSGASLLSLDLLPGSGDYIIGFNTNQSFDTIEIVLSGVVNLLNSTKIYHAVLREYCAGPALDCNVATTLSLPTYPVIIDHANTGMSGISVGSIGNVDNVISSSTTDFATINLTVGLLASGSIAVKDQITDYPSGTYAGFEIENSNLVSVSALGNMVISTYLNGVFREQFSGNNLVVNGTLLSSNGRYKLGFVSTKSFDEVKITVNQTVGINLGTTKVYGAIYEKFCAGPALACNTQTAVSVPEYPVFINGENTGIDGIACVLCSVSNQDNLIDQDSSNFATVNLTAGVGTSGSLSVKDQITDYPIGTFAGYTIENPSLLAVNAFDAIRIKTYLNGVLQESKSGNGPLISVDTNLLVGTSKQTIGFVSTKAFDEVQITLTNLVSVNLGTVKVYNAVFQKFCEPIVECNKTYDWSTPDFPVTINGDNTGIDGVACVACAINNTNNLLTADTTDFANISIVAGVLGSGSVAVKDQLYTYPQGTYAGFRIKDLNTLAQVNLFQGLSIATYNNGVLQELKSAGDILDLGLLGIPVLGTGPGTYNVGFQASLEFDEIRLTVNSIASVINSINVYGAFVNTANSDGGSGSALQCNSSSISITKEGIYVDANLDSIVNVGDKIVYTFDIKNTGFETLTNVTVTDDNATVSGTAIPSLAAGENNTTAFTAEYLISQADIDAGVVYNLATATGTPPVGMDVTATSTDPTPCATCPVIPTCLTCTATPLIQTPKLGFVKTGVYNGDPTKAKIGDVITYTFTVTNTGNVTVENVLINDAKLGVTDLAIVPSSLAPLGVGVITQDYVVTQGDIDSGKVTNTAIAKGQDTLGNDVQDISGTTVDNDTNTVTDLPTAGKIVFVKTGVYNGDVTKAKAGDIITYTFTVTNTGNVSVEDIVVNDAKLGVTNLAIVPNTLAPLGVGVITKDYIVTQDDVNAGKVTNSAIAKGEDPDGNTVQDISGTTIDNDISTVTNLPQTPKLAFVKEGLYKGDPTKAKVGDIITYTFTVTNTGNVTVNNILINDAKLGMTNLPTVPSNLLPLGVGVITKDYVLTQADIDAGKVTNTAIAKGQDSLGNTVQDTSGTAIDNDDSTVTNLPQLGKLSFLKEAVYKGDVTKAKVGDIITYTFTITNTGNVTLSAIGIMDAKLGVNNVAVVPSTLAPLQDGIITYDYAVTQADIDAGNVTNTAIAKGKDPQGIEVQDISGTTVDTDDSTVTDLPQTSKIAFVKTGVYNGDVAKAKVGDKITYTFTVTNTGNVTVANILINDTKLGVTDLPLVPITLAPLGVGIATLDYIVTQEDIDAGKVTNTAIAKGQDLLGNDVQDTSGTTIDNDDITVTTLPQIGKIAFVKTGVYNGDVTKAKVGDKVTYTFTVTNTGNQTVKDIVINDAKLGVTDLSIVPNTLKPLEFGVITQDYVVTQADIDAGKVTNTAIAKGKDPQDNDVQDISGTTVDNDDSTITTLPQMGALAFVKTGDYKGAPTKAVVGDKITYTFTVTNTGNVTVNNILINDAKLGVTNLAIVPSTLGPLEVGVVTQDYTVTQLDIDSGKVTNTAIAKGQDLLGNDVQDISGTAVNNNISTVTNLPTAGKLVFLKEGVYNGDAAKAKVGDKITYTFTITNTGNVTVNNILINDSKLGLTDVALVPSTLAPTEFGIMTRDYIVTQADIDAGKVTNSAIARGQDLEGNNVQDTSGTTIDNDDSTVTNLPQKGALAFVKTGDYMGDVTKAKVGDVIKYTFTVTNTGNLTVNNVRINDTKLGVTDLAIVPSNLVPLEFGMITKDYVVTQEDIDAGKVTNTAIAKGQDLLGNDVQDTSGTTIDNDDSTITTLPQEGKLAFVKTGVYNGDVTKAKVGDKITYTFTVTNTGNLTVMDIIINDAKLGVTDLPIVPSTLKPLEFGVITQDYFVTQADIDAGKVTNTAIAKGKDPQGIEVQDISGTTVDTDDSTVTDLPQTNKIAFVKTGVYNGDVTKAKVGDTITYTFTVTNTGNVTVSNIVINDAKLEVTDLGIVPSTLLPLDEGVITKEYEVTQADIDAGKVINTAIAKGQDPQGNNVEDTSGTSIDNDDSTETNLPQKSSIALVKTAVLPANVAVGQSIVYTFSVTNTGNTIIKDIKITDPLTDLILPISEIAILAPGATNNSIVGTYLIKQLDINAGQVVNSALAVGKNPEGNEVSDVSGTTVTTDDPTITKLIQTPSISLTKDGAYEDTNADGIASVGDKIKYVFEVKNTGNTVLTNVIVTDTKVSVQGVMIPTLGVGVSNNTGFTAEYFITQDDINKGYVYNLAEVNAFASNGALISNTSTDPTINSAFPIYPTCSMCTITAVPQSPKIALMMTGVFEDTNGDGQAQIGETIRYTYTVMNIGNVPLTNVWVQDEVLGHGIADGAINLPIGATDKTTFSAVYNITQNDIIQGFSMNQSKVFGTSPLGIIVQDMSDDTSPFEDDPTVLGVKGCDVKVFNAVSPDGDGLNDFFRIQGIDCYPDNTVQIFDRWGVKVFEVQGYDNDTRAFRGKSEGRVTVSQSDGLPSGTYFYAIKYVDKNNNGFNKSGYLELINE